MAQRSEKSDGRALPRGASPSEMDQLRASLRVTQRGIPRAPLPAEMPRPVLPLGAETKGASLPA